MAAVTKENRKLHTRVKCLEAEVDKLEVQRPNSSKYTYISLKKMYRDSRTTIGDLQNQIQKLKNSIKATRTSELEVEIRVLKDECQRLKRIILELGANA